MKFRVTEITTMEQVDFWEFRANSKRELKKNLNNPYFQQGGVKLDGHGPQEIKRKIIIEEVK